MTDTNPDDSGPAFPSGSVADACGDQYPLFTGMSLRDYFAGQALAEVPDPETISDAAKTAELAYAIADAMLAERAKGDG